MDGEVVDRAEDAVGGLVDERDGVVAEQGVGAASQLERLWVSSEHLDGDLRVLGPSVDPRVGDGLEVGGQARRASADRSGSA
jgi:hypothetical protein